MVVAIASLVHFAFCARAAARCAKERWRYGLAAAIVRLVLLTLVALGAFSSPRSAALGLGSNTAVLTGSLGLAVLLAALVGPLLAFGATYAAWRRGRDLPASQQESAGRLLHGWIPVAVIDGIIVVIQLGSLVIARDY